jgi:hypothetical protein
MERIASVITVPRNGERGEDDPWAGQVSGVMWSDDGKKILASHGARFSLSSWEPERQMDVVRAHEGRILCLAGNGKRVATFCAGDESLKIWEPKGWNAPGSKAHQIRDITVQTAAMYIR